MNGLNHSPLDEYQKDWYCHLFPYKLANYRKKLLSTPAVCAVLDYSGVIQSSPVLTYHVPITNEGICDGVAVWVDYDLGGSGSNSVIHQWDYTAHNFRPYLKQSMKFFPQRLSVSTSSTLQVSTCFNVGDTDYSYDFRII